MEVLVWIVVPVILLGAAAITTAEEASASLLTRSRVRRLLDTEQRGAAPLEWFAEQPSRLHAAAAAARAAAFASFGLAGWVLASAAPSATAGWLQPLAALLGAAIAFSLCDALPRALAVQNPEGVALAFARVARPIVSDCASLRSPGLGAMAGRDAFDGIGPADCLALGREKTSSRRLPPTTRRRLATSPRKRFLTLSLTSPRRSSGKSWCRARTWLLWPTRRRSKTPSS